MTSVNPKREASWRLAQQLYAQQSPGWAAGPSFREALELLCVSLMYQRNALEEYSHIPHTLLRGPSSALSTGANLTATMSANDPLFGSFSQPEAGRGNAHLASVSFRLTVAVLKTIEAVASGAQPFVQSGLLRITPDEWDRGRAAGFFQTLQGLGCCTGGALGLDQAAIVVLVHRDDFGHGEAGSGSGAWRQGREGCLNSIYACRVFEAQDLLIEWSLNELRKVA